MTVARSAYGRRARRRPRAAGHGWSVEHGDLRVAPLPRSARAAGAALLALAAATPALGPIVRALGPHGRGRLELRAAVRAAALAGAARTVGRRTRTRRRSTALALWAAATAGPAWIVASRRTSPARTAAAGLRETIMSPESDLPGRQPRRAGVVGAARAFPRRRCRDRRSSPESRSRPRSPRSTSRSSRPHWSGSSGGFSSLPDVAALFGNPWLLLAGWTHYLAFDLLVGSWEVRDARDRGVPHRLVLPCLALTFLFGPAGWLLYRSLRTAYTRRSNIVASPA